MEHVYVAFTPEDLERAKAGTQRLIAAGLAKDKPLYVDELRRILEDALGETDTAALARRVGSLVDVLTTFAGSLLVKLAEEWKEDPLDLMKHLDDTFDAMLQELRGREAAEG
jgi:hypothetical protein